MIALTINAEAQQLMDAFNNQQRRAIEKYVGEATNAVAAGSATNALLSGTSTVPWLTVTNASQTLFNVATNGTKIPMTATDQDASGLVNFPPALTNSFIATVSADLRYGQLNQTNAWLQTNYFRQSVSFSTNVVTHRSTVHQNGAITINTNGLDPTFTYTSVGYGLVLHGKDILCEDEAQTGGYIISAIPASLKMYLTGSGGGFRCDGYLGATLAGYDFADALGNSGGMGYNPTTRETYFAGAGNNGINFGIANRILNVTSNADVLIGYSTATTNRFQGLLIVSNSFLGNGATNTLPNQTLTANGSIITRSLGDARYVTNGQQTVFLNSNNTFVVNLTNTFNGPVVISGTNFSGASNFVFNAPAGTFQSDRNGTNIYIKGSMKFFQLDDGGGLGPNYPRGGFVFVGSTNDNDGFGVGDYVWSSLSLTNTSGNAEGRISMFRGILSGTNLFNKGGKIQIFTKDDGNFNGPTLRAEFDNSGRFIGSTASSSLALITNWNADLLSLRMRSAINNGGNKITNMLAGTGPLDAVNFTQLQNVTTNTFTLTNWNPVINSIYTNDVRRANLTWAAYMAPGVAGTCEMELWVEQNGATNVYPSGLLAITGVGVTTTVKGSCSAWVQPSGVFWFTNIQTSGTQYITNFFMHKM